MTRFARPHALSLLALLLLAAPVSAQGGKTYDLSPKYKLGDKQEVEARASVLLKVRLVLATQGIDRTSEQEQVVERRYQDTLTKVEGGQVAEVERSFSSAWTGVREPGAPDLVRELDPHHQRKIVIGKDSQGKRKVWARHGKIEKAAIAGELPTERYDWVLPAEPKAIGDTWTISGKNFQRAVGSGLGDDPKGTIECTLSEVREDLVQPADGPELVAVVGMVIKGSGKRGAEADAPRMSTQMKGGLRFSLKRGKIVTVDLRGEARLRQTRREGDDVLELEGRGPMTIKKRAWFPRKPKRKR